ncbi:TetR/AcrR family transcriptional regulator [Joostella atrarenae]|uniref:TetR/AcrR family transcriptional regulator n=1 Tax=Joostella atrarenae TaxID=679257 RepID=A0ABS9J359_9FLAO|nr:TetR/AcrR family transcriptional regulator [Joostella atrarenae]MCF8714864.1 TetR/AcrR family transcriptional regulator [Joostella atrarenae]
MKLPGNLRFTINEKLYLKDPESSELGRNILKHSIILIDEIGFEAFTFKKLGECIGSNESSIYRYFENKHRLLLYISSWYWSWLEYRMLLAIQNIDDSLEKLHRVVFEVTSEVKDDVRTEYIDEAILNRIIISEYSKAFLTKEVDKENKDGFFLVYKKVISIIADIITEVKPDYKYSKSLASSVVVGALNQHFIKQHFKTITDFCEPGKDVPSFYIETLDKILL